MTANPSPADVREALARAVDPDAFTGAQEIIGYGTERQGGSLAALMHPAFNFAAWKVQNAYERADAILSALPSLGFVQAPAGWRRPTDADWTGEFFLGAWRGASSADVVRWIDGEWQDERGEVFGQPDWIMAAPAPPEQEADHGR